MIPEVSIISRKVSIASVNRAGGLGVLWDPQLLFLGSKEYLDWLKIDLNAAKIIMYLSMRIHSKSCPIFTQKVAATLLKSSRKGAATLLKSSRKGVVVA